MEGKHFCGQPNLNIFIYMYRRFPTTFTRVQLGQEVENKRIDTERPNEAEIEWTYVFNRRSLLWSAPILRCHFPSKKSGARRETSRWSEKPCLKNESRSNSKTF